MAAATTQFLLSITPLKSQTKPIRKPTPSLTIAKLRAAVIGGGPAGASAAETLAKGGIETYLIERSPSGTKPCGGAIPLCMLDEFSLPESLIDRRVTRMRIISPSNLTADFGSALLPGQHIPMLRREILDSFLRDRAVSHGAHLLHGLFTSLTLPPTPHDPYLIHYNAGGKPQTLAADVIIGADGANSRVAKSINAGSNTHAIAFQERIRLPDAQMQHYSDLAEMYIGDDVSPDFYAWVFPKCDHVAVGTGTISSKHQIKKYQSGIRRRAKEKIVGGEVIKVEAHPIPEHPRARRVVGRVALVGDAAGYVTKCAGEGIYFAAKSGRVCGEAVVRASEGGERMVKEEEMKEGYLRRWDGEFGMMFRFMGVLERVFYGSNWGREALVEMCGDEYVQKRTFESYLYKRMKMGKDDWIGDLGLGMRTLECLGRNFVVGREVNRLKHLLENEAQVSFYF